MDTSAPTPSWLVGMLAIFSLAAAAVFGLYLYRHAERAGLAEQHTGLSLQLVPLREEAARLEGMIPLLDKQIQERKALIQPIEAFDATNRADVDRALTNNGAMVKAAVASQTKAVTSFTEAMKEAPERRKEVGAEEERAFKTERDNDERRRQLREDVEKQSQAVEAQKKIWRGDKAKLDDRIAELESRIRQLTNQLDASNRELKSDGSILASEAKDGFVVIDRGFANQLRTGTKFSVFTKRGGRVVIKGQIQVTEVKERIATARVLDEADANDPLVSGDQLHNPVYDPDHQRSFAVRGDFRRFSRTEIGRFIEESGGRLDQQLTVNVDFLVAGSGAAAEIEQASNLGMSVISEDQLLDFLRYDERPSRSTWDYILAAAKDGKRFGFAGDFAPVSESTIRGALQRIGARTSGGVAEGYAGLIVGAGAENEMAKARSLGVPVIDQRNFSRLVDVK